MWKIGTELQLKNSSNSWSKKVDTLIFVQQDKKWIYAERKGEPDVTYPYHADELELVSRNPFIIIKRMFCRAFECSYK